MPTLEERQLPRSVVRHRPIAPDAMHTQVQTPRAGHSRQKREPHTTGGPPLVGARLKAKPKASGIRSHLSGAGDALRVFPHLGGSTACELGRTTLDDLHYGRPRTTQVDHFVGHEAAHVPSHFLAFNLSGQIYVVEIPGGTNTSRLLVGPRLIGPGF